jgi:hypothetical protein
MTEAAPNTDIVNRARGGALVPTKFARNIQPKSKRGATTTQALAKLRASMKDKT